MRGKWFTVVISLLLFIVVIIGCPKPAITQPKPFKIGYVAGLTGPLAIYSIPCLTGMKYVTEEINRAGGIQGRQVEIIVRDGKERPDVSLSEARNLVLNEGVDVLFGATSGPVVLALSSFAKEQKMIFMVPASGTQVCGKEGHRYVFKPACWNSDNLGYSLGEYLAGKPWKKYYLIGSDYIFGHEMINYAWKRLTQNKPGVEKVGEFWPRFGERDYTSYITSIMAANPEAVIALLPGTFGVDFIKQAKGYGFFKKIQYTSGMMVTTELVALGKETPEGIIGVAEYVMPYCSEKYPIAKKLQERYDRDFKDCNYGPMSTGYDTMLFLWEAIKRSGSTDTEKIISAMEGLKIDTAVGAIKCLKYSHQGAVPIFVGTTGFSPKYPFAIMKDVKVYQGEKIMVSEDEIRKMRGE